MTQITQFDSLSIALQQNFSGKSNQQILQQFEQITRRIAQSDRNNVIYREMKKQKSDQFNELSMKKSTLQRQHDDLTSQYKRINNDLLQAKSMIRKNEEYFELVTKNYESKYQQQKEIQAQTIALSKQNEKLQRKFTSLQMQHDQLLKSNKEKHNKLVKWRKQKEEKNKQQEQNEQKIQQLQRACEKTKSQAEKIQKEVKKEREIFIELKKILELKEGELNQRQKERDELVQKQEQTKKVINKMMATAKNIEEEIDRKMTEMKNLEKVHSQYEMQIIQMEVSQKRLEDMLIKRKELIANMRKCSGRIVKEKQANQEIKSKAQQGNNLG